MEKVNNNIVDEFSKKYNMSGYSDFKKISAVYAYMLDLLQEKYFGIKTITDFTINDEYMVYMNQIVSNLGFNSKIIKCHQKEKKTEKVSLKFYCALRIEYNKK